MSLRSPRIWVVVLVTLGSGLLNIVSVISPPQSEHGGLLRDAFPLDFIHASRFVTLLIGFALVVSSINIYRRKRRAFQSVLLLACASIIFHLTVGVDYQEAMFSLVLLVVLISARRSFTVKSSTADWGETAIRLTFALLVALGYGVAGFWLLDKREFGINFTIGNSVITSLRFLTLVSDPRIVPHTRYAHWFIDSLYMMTATAILYSGFALFRPVVFRYRTHPHESELARAIAERHGRSSLDYFKLTEDKSFFFPPSDACFLAYRVGGSFALVLGDPVGPEAEIEETARLFLAYCRDNDWGTGFYQTLADYLPKYRRLGLKTLKIGDCAIVDLTRFSLEGKSMKDVRNAAHKLERRGIATCFWAPPLPDEVLDAAQEVSEEWLDIPGRRERGFSLGQFDPGYVRLTPLFAAVDGGGRLLAFANTIPSYRTGETTIDLMRRRTAAPNGIMDYLFVRLFELSRQQGYERFSLGMAPMAGFREREQASREERAVHYFFQRLNFLFSYRGLREYKAKFASSWEPRYAVYRSALDLPRLALALSKVSEVRS